MFVLSLKAHPELELKSLRLKPNTDRLRDRVAVQDLKNMGIQKELDLPLDRLEGIRNKEAVVAAFSRVTTPGRS